MCVVTPASSDSIADGDVVLPGQVVSGFVRRKRYTSADAIQYNSSGSGDSDHDSPAADVADELSALVPSVVLDLVDVSASTMTAQHQGGPAGSKTRKGGRQYRKPAQSGDVQVRACIHMYLCVLMRVRMCTNLVFIFINLGSLLFLCTGGRRECNRLLKCSY